VTKLRAGMWLHFSCSDDWLGPILKAYDNENGEAVIDIDVPDINEFVFFEDFSLEADNEERYRGSLTRIEPAAVRIIGLSYKLSNYEGSVTCELRMPEGGCFRCTQGCGVYSARDISFNVRPMDLS
jgi:hypothetical protein